VAVFVFFKVLELLDEVELEFDRYPGNKLECDILVGVSASIASGFGDYPDISCLFYPLLGDQGKAVQTCLHSNPVEFDGIDLEPGQLVSGLLTYLILGEQG